MLTEKPTNLSRRGETVLLLAILLLAGTLRLGWPGLTEFKADEARLMALALDMAEGVSFPIRGISSSVGFANFPMSVWLYALPLALWRHVYAATLFTGLLNTLAVLGCYWLARRYWGVEAALAAALMFAVSPWAVHHSRKIWAQNLLPFFVVGWGISGALAFIERRPKFIIVHLLCLAVAVQAHLAGIALLLATMLFLVIFRRRVNWRLAGLGAALAALTALPFAYYLTTSGESVTAVLSGTGAAARPFTFTAFRYAWLLISGQEIHALTGPEAFAAFLETAPEMTAVYLLWGALILGGFGWLGWRGRGHSPAAEAGILLWVWTVAPLILFTWPRLPVVLHYLLPIYPAPYIAAGVLFSRLARIGRAISWAALGASALAQVWLWGRLLVFVSGQATPGGVGPPLARQLAAAAQAKQMLAETGAAEILIAGAGDAPQVDAFPAVYSVLLRDAPHRFVDVRQSAVFPATAAVVFLDPAAGEGTALYQAAASPVETIPLRRGEGSLQVLALAATAVPTPAFTFDPPRILTNWAAFWGYDAPILHEDGTATWRVYWYAGEPSLADYHLFNHLLNADGDLVSQKDTAVFPARQWQAKDVVVSMVELDWPVGEKRPFTMRTGMYSYPDLTPALIFDVAGNPYTDALEITLP